MTCRLLKILCVFLFAFSSITAAADVLILNSTEASTDSIWIVPEDSDQFISPLDTIVTALQEQNDTLAISLLEDLKALVRNVTFKNPKAAEGQRGALLNKIDAVIKQVRAGAYKGALNKIKEDIKGKLVTPEYALISHPPTKTVYEIKLDVSKTFNQGANLKIKFYSYSGAYQAEITVWSGTTPAHVELSTQVPHPLNLPVKIATLVLTDETGNVISSITTFIMYRSHLTERLTKLEALWITEPGTRGTMFREIVVIDGQWPYAP